MQTFLTRTFLPRLLRCSLAPLVLSAGLALTPPVQAQGLFSPFITVNDSVITRYEFEQRVLLIELLRTPGDPVENARNELINDRLRAQALADAGIDVTEEGIQAGIDEFAGRANITLEQFRAILDENGIAPETFRDFIRISIGWREFLSRRFLARARPTDDEVDRALGQAGGSSVQLQLAEVIMPVNAQNLEQVEAIAEEIKQVTSYDAFSSAARQFSAAQSRQNGGSLGWLPLTRLPQGLRPVLLDLEKGEVTNPVRLQNSLALFQMRGIREVATAVPRYSAIEYATYLIPGGRSPEALATAKSVSERIDTCDDLYGVAKDQPEETLARQSLPPADIPRDIAVELAKLDNNEISTTITRNNGATLMLLMMCGRTAELGQDASREEIMQGLTQQRLNTIASSYLEQLRAEATIVEK